MCKFPNCWACDRWDGCLLQHLGTKKWRKQVIALRQVRYTDSGMAKVENKVGIIAKYTTPPTHYKCIIDLCRGVVFYTIVPTLFPTYLLLFAIPAFCYIFITCAIFCVNIQALWPTASSWQSHLLLPLQILLLVRFSCFTCICPFHCKYQYIQ